MMRVGFGYDVHRLVSGRRLILGGVEIPYEYGLDGHSDADVLIHAICDALLGACGQGDIGRHFPDTESKYKDISSTLLLRNVYMTVCRLEYCISNIDTVIVCQRPKLSGYFPNMKKILSAILNIAENAVNIKATTEEGMGFTGNHTGIKAYCTALIYYSQYQDQA